MSFWPMPSSGKKLVLENFRGSTAPGVYVSVSVPSTLTFHELSVYHSFVSVLQLPIMPCVFAHTGVPLDPS